MLSPFLIARLVFFAVLFYLNVVGLGFAAWTIRAMTKAGSEVVGPPLFIIVNACALFLFLFVALAEMVTPAARTAQVKFECGWTAALSILNLAAAVDVAINGPPVYCHAQEWMAVCASTTVLVATTWASSIILLMYFLVLFLTAYSHQSSYGAVWEATVYNVPWFVERELPSVKPQPQLPAIVIPKLLAGPYENPVFLAHDEEKYAEIEEDMADMRLSPPLPPFAHNAASRLSDASSPRVAPDPTDLHSSFRPSWAKRVMTRRGIDPPFCLRRTGESAADLERQFGPPPVPPKPGLPPPSGLNGGFLDIRTHDGRLSYAQFPQGVADPDRPLGYSPRSKWVRADDSSVSSVSQYDRTNSRI